MWRLIRQSCGDAYWIRNCVHAETRPPNCLIGADSGATDVASRVISVDSAHDPVEPWNKPRFRRHFIIEGGSSQERMPLPHSTLEG